MMKISNLRVHFPCISNSPYHAGPIKGLILHDIAPFWCIGGRIQGKRVTVYLVYIGESLINKTLYGEILPFQKPYMEVCMKFQ